LEQAYVKPVMKRAIRERLVSFEAEITQLLWQFLGGALEKLCPPQLRKWIPLSPSACTTVTKK